MPDAPFVHLHVHSEYSISATGRAACQTRRAGRQLRDAGRDAHRPRLDGGRRPALEGDQGNRRTLPSSHARRALRPLHVHSEYSILDGACRVPRRSSSRPATSRCRPSRSPTTARWRCAVQLWKATKGTGVKPIIGCEVYVADDRRAQQKGYAHLTLLARDNAGYSNLIKLSSLGYLEGYYYKPRVDWELLESHREGLIALSGCLSGRVCKALEENRAADAHTELDRLGQVFGRDNVYVELQNAHLDVQQRILPQLAELAGKVGLPTVATGDVHYLRHSDARAHEALLCIQSGDSLKNPNHWKFDTDHFYFKSPEEMALDFPGHEDAMRRTLEVAERCNVEIELGRILLPHFPVPDGREASTISSSCARKACKSATERSRPSSPSACGSSSRRSRRWASPTTS